MKYYFFINPVAGQGKHEASLRDEINKAMEKRPEDYEIIISEAQGDLLWRTAEIAESLNGEEARFYAAGGDGTVNEVVNGIIGHPNISVGVIPVGTGNDLIRNYPEAGNFNNIEAQINGSVVPMDLIRYRGVVDGRKQTSYCVNMINIGFDCNVVELAGRLKKKPLIAGSFAYLLAVLGKFIEKKGIALRITEYGDNVLSDNVIRDGEMLLCAVCNGSYCGGGIKSSPTSVLNDGIIELNLINNLSRRRFLGIFPKFKKGEHMDLPGVDEIVEVRGCKEAMLESHDSFEFFICVDGEIKTTQGIRVNVVPEGLNFIIPAK